MSIKAFFIYLSYFAGIIDAAFTLGSGLNFYREAQCGNVEILKFCSINPGNIREQPRSICVQKLNIVLKVIITKYVYVATFTFGRDKTLIFKTFNNVII